MISQGLRQFIGLFMSTFLHASKPAPRTSPQTCPVNESRRLHFSSCKQARPQNQIPRPAHAQALRHWRLQTHAKLQLQCHSKLFKTRHCCCCSTNNWTTVTNHITNCDNRLTPNPTHLCWPAMDPFQVSSSRPVHSDVSSLSIPIGG